MKLLLSGINHRSAPLALRERFAVAEMAPWLEKLQRGGEIDEAVLVSTCNRVEVTAVTRNLEAARLRLEHFFLRELGAEVEPPPPTSVLYHHVDRDAVRHLFRVAASLDSMVVGEPQILGQVKDAYRGASESGASGAILNRLFANAFKVAKRVRSDTDIASRPVSVARVAVDLARQIFDELRGKRALLVGAGEMIELALESLRGAGLAHVEVVNRTRERAEELAGRFGATAHGLEELPERLRSADIVLASLAVDRPVLDGALFREATRGRRDPIFAIDLGVPRNIDPATAELADVYLYDMDDLAEVATANAAERSREAQRAEGIVDAGVQRFDGWLSALRAAPTIRQLRARADAVRAEELDKALRKLALEDDAREVVEALSSRSSTRFSTPRCLACGHTPNGKRASRPWTPPVSSFALDDPDAPGAQADEDAAQGTPKDAERGETASTRPDPARRGSPDDAAGA